MYLTPPMKGFLRNWVWSLGSKTTRIVGAAGLRKKFDDIFSHLDIIPERDKHCAKIALIEYKKLS